jgi:hypothetical protein
VVCGLPINDLTHSDAGDKHKEMPDPDVVLGAALNRHCDGRSNGQYGRDSVGGDWCMWGIVLTATILAAPGLSREVIGEVCREWRLEVPPMRTVIPNGDVLLQPRESSADAATAEWDEYIQAQVEALDKRGRDIEKVQALKRKPAKSAKRITPTTPSKSAKPSQPQPRPAKTSQSSQADQPGFHRFSREWLQGHLGQVLLRATTAQADVVGAMQLGEAGVLHTCNGRYGGFGDIVFHETPGPLASIFAMPAELKDISHWATESPIEITNEQLFEMIGRFLGHRITLQGQKHSSTLHVSPAKPHKIFTSGGETRGPMFKQQAGAPLLVIQFSGESEYLLFKKSYTDRSSLSLFSLTPSLSPYVFLCALLPPIRPAHCHISLISKVEDWNLHAQLRRVTGNHAPKSKFQ